ncbi:hypothetical protein L211DRAFT_836032 [Terfezia boudieri ATCC MYA-4762]|uniref:Uncharacterized protein n=1 Tax=Terfezia boudieri ATCC MYA-4762 TaxID=1051890 RepID=A0A3N4LSQ8_9PEZI|nr:hypothetical protein L211DRAFT_836032 [Terfezia boudieri ATCC MYA-4762]
MNMQFPKKEEWLVEWTVQRLKEEEGDGGVEARLSGRPPPVSLLPCSLPQETR